MKRIPYGRQTIDQEDIDAVVGVLRGDWLTTGPMVERFETAFAAHVGAAHAVAVNSGTAALHLAMHAVGIGAEDEVIVPALTFAATSNAVLYCGGTPVFADVRDDTLLVDPEDVARKITPRTKAIVSVDYAGQPADYDALRALADRAGLALVADACHALGAEYDGRAVGTLADLSTFSLHPVKPITTCEGGIVTTGSPKHAAAMRRFRNHGIESDARSREVANLWRYDMVVLGYNYRLNEVQSALGLSQLARLGRWTARRQEIARRYDEAFTGSDIIRPVTTAPGRTHARHLYVVRVPDREGWFADLRSRDIGVQVHYLPVYLHTYYRQLGFTPGLCPVAERAASEILSLPVFPRLTDEEQTRVIEVLLGEQAARAEGTLPAA